MPLQASRLRRWFAFGAIAMVAIVMGTYYYAKWRVNSALQEVKEKIGIEIKQSAQGFTISKSVAGRTLFKIEASKAIQYRQGEHAELHDVNITLYGEDSSRFDQIYGADFEYDPQSGNVTAKGEVHIDLEANPEGIAHPDQALPKELKNPIHLKTSGLVFNQKTGNAYTKERIEFRIPQAEGSAVGASYEAKTRVLTLQSEVTASIQGNNPAKVTAARASVTKRPGLVTLEQPRAQSGTEKFEADEIKFFLRPDNTLDRTLAIGRVFLESRGPQPVQVRAQQLDVAMSPPSDKPASVNDAKFSGDVHWETPGEQPLKGRAGVMLLEFAGRNSPRKVRTQQGVELTQRQESGSDLNLSAANMDFLIAGNHLERSETSGPGKIVIADNSAQQTRVTAGKFEARFNNQGRLVSLHGTPDARIESVTPGQPDRISTSESFDVTFGEKGGVKSLTQQGNVVYTDGSLKASGGGAVYTASDQMLLLTGSPRVVLGGMTTTADAMRLNRKTGDFSADGNVKSTYSDLKPQPGGALLASGDPIHVTARSVAAHRSPAVATYSGAARLWQQANVVEAPSIEFDRDYRSVIARGAEGKRVSTTLVQAGTKGQSMPLTILSGSLAFVDSDNKVHFGDGVVGSVADNVMSADQMDAYRQGGGGQTGNKAEGTPKIDRIVAQGHVVITQPGRKASGEQLTYTSLEDKFVMTGGIPSIFDAEHGKITGVSLTFFRRDARVLVEGKSGSPAVTQTRVAR